MRLWSAFRFIKVNSKILCHCVSDTELKSNLVQIKQYNSKQAHHTLKIVS